MEKMDTIEIKEYYDDGMECGSEWHEYNGKATGRIMKDQHGNIKREVEIIEYKRVGIFRKKIVKNKYFIEDKNLKIWTMENELD